MENNEVQRFTLDFFNNLKCQASWQGPVLVVRNIPKDFESFAGKKGPYFLVFDPQAMKPETELVTKGSFLLKAMAGFLDSAGQTSLIKIPGPPDLTTSIKNALGISSSELYGFTKRAQFVLISRFTFLTSIQHVNDKEQIVNEIYVKDGKVIDFDLSRHVSEDGRKEEISFDDLKPAYTIAKSHLRSVLDPKIKEISNILAQKMEKEIQRVKDHYDQQIKEHKQELDKQKNTIDEIKSQFFSGKDVPNSKAKVVRAKEIIGKLESENRIEKLLKEKEFFINDEVHKHSLSIDNKLINTTLIYYPIFSCSFSLRSPQALSKPLQVSYDVLEGKTTPILCEVCANPLKKTVLCSSGHLICEACALPCRSCGTLRCNACSARLCDICSQPACRKCLQRCSGCGQSVCSNHLASRSPSLCSNCMHSCAFCSQKFPGRQLAKCPSCKRGLCSDCSPKYLIKKAGVPFCTLCSQKCSTCGAVLPKDSFNPAACTCRSCSDLRRCSRCRASLCPLRKTMKK